MSLQQVTAKYQQPLHLHAWDLCERMEPGTNPGRAKGSMVNCNNLSEQGLKLEMKFN